MGQSDFDRKLAKGKEGEKRLAEELARLGCDVDITGGPLRFELDGVKFSLYDVTASKEGHSFLVQVKAKEPRKLHPDTGFSEEEYQHLRKVETDKGLPIMLAFVNSKAMYGIWLHDTSFENSHLGYNVKDDEQMRYWWLSALKPLSVLLQKMRAKRFKQKFLGDYS